MLAQKAWRMIRTLIFTYLVSGVLLTALAFALYKFRLPESQITLGISGVYILSCFMGGFMAGKAMRPVFRRSTRKVPSFSSRHFFISFPASRFFLYLQQIFNALLGLFLLKKFF